MDIPKLMPEGRTPTMSDVAKAALVNPIVAHCLACHQEGDLTLEQSLITMVVALVDQNRGLVEQLVEAMQWSCKPIRIGSQTFLPDRNYLQWMFDQAAKEARIPPAPR